MSQPHVASLSRTLSPAFPFPAPACEGFQAGIIEDSQIPAVFQRRFPEIFFEFRNEKTRMVVTAFLRHIFDRQRIAPQKLRRILHSRGDQILERRTVQLTVEHPVERAFPDLEMFRHPFQREVGLEHIQLFELVVERGIYTRRTALRDDFRKQRKDRIRQETFQFSAVIRENDGLPDPVEIRFHGSRIAAPDHFPSVQIRPVAQDRDQR